MPEPAPNPAPFRTADAMKDGLVAGLAGAFAVAAVHGLADVIAGAPLRTPTLLGLLFAHGAESAARTTAPDLAVAFRFTVLHMAVWIVLGAGASLLVSWVDSRPRFASVAFGAFAFVFISASYLSGAYSIEGLPPLHLWVGTLIGAAAAAAYLSSRHPHLAQHIERERMTAATRREIERALGFELEARTALEAAVTRFPDSPLARIAQDKRAHLEPLVQAAADLGLQATDGKDAAWKAETHEEALRRALAHEHQGIELYDSFLAAVPEVRIRELFLRLRVHAADTVVPELEGALDDSA